MDLIDKEHIASAEIRQQRGQIARLFDRGTGCHAQIDAHLTGDDARKRRLAETGGAVEQHMIQRFAAAPCRLDVDREILLDLVLPDVVLKGFRAKRALQLRILRDQLRCGKALLCAVIGLMGTSLYHIGSQSFGSLLKITLLADIERIDALGGLFACGLLHADEHKPVALFGEALHIL